MYSCYLLCFEAPIRGKHHYIGMTEKTVAARVREHADGTMAAVMTTEAIARGVKYHAVRAWVYVPATFERFLKSRNGAASMCPRCNPKSWAKNAPHEGSILLWPVISDQMAGPVPVRPKGESG